MANSYDFHDDGTLLGIVNDPDMVAHADETGVHIENPNDGFLEKSEEFKAVHNSATGEIFGVVTDEYNVINPPEFFGPLAAELSDRDITPEGTVTVFNGGSSGYAEVLVGDGIYPIDRTGEQEPVRAGVTVRWSHDGGVSVRASAFAQDGMCSNTMRRVSDSIYVKHAGDEDRVDFADEWTGVLDQLGAFSDALESVINDAFDFVLFDFEDHEFSNQWLDVTEEDRLEKLADEDPPAFLNEAQRDGLAGFYGLLGFPRYICYEATKRAMWRLVQKANNGIGDPSELTAWDAYSAVTYALTHQARFDAGSSSDDEYHRIASDLLQNPQMAEDDAGFELHQRMHADDEEEDEGLLIEGDTGDAARAFKDADRMRQALQAE